MPRKPNFFIVGAPKCGTTSMYRYLQEHPDVSMADRKDLYYFGADLDLTIDRPTEEQYLASFAAAGDERWVGESSVQYLRSESAASEIKAYMPDARIMIMLRNPIDFLYSYHGQLVYHLEENIYGFEEAMRAQADRREGRRIPEGYRAPSKLQYYRIAAFAGQVERWFEVFGREEVLVMLMDDMTRDTPAAYRRTLEFLDVDPDFRPEFVRHNQKRWLEAPGVRKFLRRHPRIRGAAYRVVSGRMREKAARALSRVFGSPEREPITPAFRAELVDHFRPEIERLGRLLDRDLSHWCDPRPSSTPR